MYTQLKEKFENQFGHKASFVFSAPGRTELGGNHTDHQHGKVLAAAVNREALAAVALNGTNTVNLLSEGYPICHIDLTDLTVHPEEVGKTPSLIRGVASQFAAYGLPGFDAYVTSNVLSGSGLSSSAAFEVLMGVTMGSAGSAKSMPMMLPTLEAVWSIRPQGLPK